MKASTERFSDRVENYVRYRPTYPLEVVDTLRRHCRLEGEQVVADIGSGTGLLSALLLEGGFRVLAVEPNKEMRLAAERKLGGNPRFNSVTGTAERSGLADESIDLITAAQAFHWFREDETRKEFRRVLKADGWVALVWNQRKTGTPFLTAYESVLHQHAPDYARSRHMNTGEDVIGRFFGRGGFELFSFENRQHFDLDGLKGRLQSSSYAPTPDQPQYAALTSSLEAAFDAHAVDGQIAFEYDTRLYVARLTDGEASRC